MKDKLKLLVMKKESHRLMVTILKLSRRVIKNNIFLIMKLI